MALDSLPRGGGKVIILSQTPLSITSVTGRIREGVPFATKIEGFKLENNRIILPTYYQTATVEYEVEGNPQEFKQFVGKDFANSFFQAQNEISEQTSQVFADAQFDKINNEVIKQSFNWYKDTKAGTDGEWDKLIGINTATAVPGVAVVSTGEEFTKVPQKKLNINIIRSGSGTRENYIDFYPKIG